MFSTFTILVIFLLLPENAINFDNVVINFVFLVRLQACFTLYHTIPTFNDTEEEGFGKHWGEKEKMLVTSIFSFSRSVFSTLSKRENIILATFNLSSTNAFNFVTSKILSFGKELRM